MTSNLSESPFDPQSVLIQLEDILFNRAAAGSNADKFPLPTACILVSKYLKIVTREGEKPSDQLFRLENSHSEKCFVGAYFSRMLTKRPDLFAEDRMFLPRLMTLLTLAAPSELFGGLGGKARAQTFEQAAVVSTIVGRMEQDLEQIIDSLRDLSALGSFRQSFLQKYRPKVTQFFLSPFLPKSLAPDVRLSELFASLENYLDEKGSHKAQVYKRAKENLDEFCREAEYPTYYAQKILRPMGARLLALLEANFGESLYAKPGEVEILGTEKRYPFGEQGARFNISFVARNRGPGQVSDLQLEIQDVTGALLGTPRVFLGDFPPGDRVVEFQAKMEKVSTEVIAIGRVSWRQFDGTSRSEEMMIPLQAQKCDLNWSNIAKEEPYGLEPVVNEKQLIGRKSTLERLLAQAGANSVSSSMIIGQKRVGKTSVVRTFQTTGERELSNVTFIYLESGDYVNPDPEQTVAGLGECICRAILDACPELLALKIPQFTNSLSPMVAFLADASKILKERRFIFVLDEFDELPLSLYKRSQVGDALFLTLRSISGKPSYGFVLVGSEKLNLILSYQGEKLNKFAQFNIDYFDREQEWSSYCELVRRPVDGWFEIDDAAIVYCYGQTAGNPFFTKLICRELFKLMVTRRDRHVTQNEMEEAAKSAIASASSVNFQHFWDDGIFEIGDKKEAISLKRRKMLMAFADGVRPDGAIGRNDLLNAANTYGIDSVVFDEYLHEFQTRHVWNVSDGFISCKVPLFSGWLKMSGVRSIITTISDPESAINARRQLESLRVQGEEVVRLTEKWGIFKGTTITDDRIRAWLSQFGSDPRTQRLMFSLLENVRFYHGAAIRAKMREAFSRLPTGISLARGRQKRNDILLSYIDGPAKSGSYYARIFADENSIYFDNIIEPSAIAERIKANDFQVILFVDDFLGTGGTAAKGLQKLFPQIGESVNSKGILCVLFAICAFEKAKDFVERSALESECNIRVLVGDVLGDKDKAFSDRAAIFANQVDRDDAKTAAYAAGRRLEPRAPLGYGDNQALVVFDSSCPNNTLPILWSRSSDWVPLFRRN